MYNKIVFNSQFKEMALELGSICYEILEKYLLLVIAIDRIKLFVRLHGTSTSARKPSQISKITQLKRPNEVVSRNQGLYLDVQILRMFAPDSFAQYNHIHKPSI